MSFQSIEAAGTSCRPPTNQSFKSIAQLHIVLTPDVQYYGWNGEMFFKSFKSNVQRGWRCQVVNSLCLALISYSSAYSCLHCKKNQWVFFSKSPSLHRPIALVLSPPVPGGTGTPGPGREARPRAWRAAEGHGGEQRLQPHGRGEAPGEDGAHRGEPAGLPGGHNGAPAGEGKDQRCRRARVINPEKTRSQSVSFLQERHAQEVRRNKELREEVTAWEAPTGSTSHLQPSPPPSPRP